MSPGGVNNVKNVGHVEETERNTLEDTIRNMRKLFPPAKRNILR